jgi:hypothetical protein
MRRRSNIWWMCWWALIAPLSFGADTGGTIAGRVTMPPGDQGVANAIVYLGGQLKSTNGQAGPVVVDFQHGRLAPRVQTAISRGVLILQNSDPTLRVVRIEELVANSQPRVLHRLAMPYAGFEKRLALPETTGVARLLRVVGENGAERQLAYLAVLPHGWAALTDQAGRFRLPNAPGGDYPIYVWQESLGSLAGRVNVTRGRETTLDLQFPRGGP